MLYQIQVKYRPSIPDNLKYWQIFEDDEQLKSFMQVVDEFSALQINEDKQKKMKMIVQISIQKSPIMISFNC